MKRLLAILTALVILLSMVTLLTGCWNGGGGASGTNNEEVNVEDSDDNKNENNNENNNDNNSENNNENNNDDNNNGGRDDLVTVLLPVKMTMRNETTESTIITRDQQGNITEISVGSLRAKYAYNQEGLLTEVMTEEVGEDGQVISAGFRTYFYDDQGNTTAYFAGGWGSTYNESLWRQQVYINFYDLNKNLIECEILSPAEIWRNKTVYTYNDRSQLIEMKDCDDGSYYAYRYNEQGLLVNEIYYNRGGEESIKKLYTYNDEGLLSQYECYYAGVLHDCRSYTYSYDAEGKILERLISDSIKGDYSLVRYIYENDCLVAITEKYGETAEAFMSATVKRLDVECVKMQVTKEEALRLQLQQDDCLTEKSPLIMGLSSYYGMAFPGVIYN